MPRSRLPAPAAPAATAATGATLDHRAVSTAVAAVDQLGYNDVEAQAKTAELAQSLGYEGPLDPDSLQYAVTLHAGRTVEEFMCFGRALLLLKERVPHGEFLRRLGVIGVAPRAARKYMQPALKFGGRPATVASAASATKLIGLLVLDDEDLDQLEGEGSVLDITLDNLARLSKSELRRVRALSLAFAAADWIGPYTCIDHQAPANPCSAPGGPAARARPRQHCRELGPRAGGGDDRVTPGARSGESAASGAFGAHGGQAPGAIAV